MIDGGERIMRSPPFFCFISEGPPRVQLTWFITTTDLYIDRYKETWAVQHQGDIIMKAGTLLLSITDADKTALSDADRYMMAFNHGMLTIHIQCFNSIAVIGA